MRENNATIWKKDTQYNVGATGLPILIAGLKHLRDAQIKFLADLCDRWEINYVLDVGANLGFTAMMFHFAFPRAQIVAIEPSSHNMSFLARNIAQVDNITAVKLAATAKNCEVEIALPTIEQRGDLRLKIEDFDNTGAISVYGESHLYREKVEGRRLDDIATQKVDYLKLDIEGYELEALKGATRILTEDRPIIQIEIRLVNQIMAGLAARDLHEYLEEFGYIRTGTFIGDCIYTPSKEVRTQMNKTVVEKTFTAPNLDLLERFSYHLTIKDINFLKKINNVKPIKVIYDVGACVGVMSVLFKNVFGDAMIYAIEPSIVNYPHLQHNAAYFPAIRPIKMAMSNKRGKINIAMPTKEQRPEIDDEFKNNPSMISVCGESDLYAEEVECVRLDDIVDEPVDLLKIDAQGHEMEVIEGAEKILRMFRPIVMLYVREGTQAMAGRTPAELLSRIKEYGYTTVGEYKGDAILFPNELEYSRDMFHGDC